MKLTAMGTTTICHFIPNPICVHAKDDLCLHSSNILQHVFYFILNVIDRRMHVLLKYALVAQ